MCAFVTSYGNKSFRISYVNLGVNQLGSVYESLLAYRGFYAEEDYIEVHKAGKPEEGTFLVPYSRMDDFQPNEILRDKDARPIILKQGTFVYRLNGRDRQKSASYYTPEILTRSTVKYTLKAIIDEVAAGKRKATELLDLKILEPAMGAAAFQNEVINQLAEAYLTYQQQQKREEGSPNWRIAPDHYRDELQKVKAYIATHNVYGVDLNPTAIELGKLSLWLNVIHKDMETPFFSNRLALGNAVIGAWLKVYSREDFAGKPDKTNSRKPKLLPTAWWEKAPHKIKFFKNRVNRSVNEVYHFLLPDKAMLAVRNIAEQKKTHIDETSRMNTLIKDWTAPITDRDFNILKRLSGKIDLLLKEYFQFQQSIENLTQNRGNIWGAPGAPALNLDTYEEKERLNDVRYRHDNAYFRLKMIMDYWCALWFWEYDHTTELPTREEYWSDIEAMLNVSDQELDAHTTRKLHNVHIDKHGQLGVFHEGYMNDMFEQAKLESMAASEPEPIYNTDEDSEIIKLSKEEVLAKTKGAERSFFDDSERFAIVKEYADRYHFFHPMLEFLEVFWLRDGFDIICGNPPWIKLEFDEKDVVSEKFPEVVIRKISAPDVQKKKQQFLSDNFLLHLYLGEQTEQGCSSIFMNSYVNYPLLTGQQTNLYKCILENGLEMMSNNGYMGLLHPDTVFADANGQPFRDYLYQKLKYHFQYQNELLLFPEVGDRYKFGAHIYGPMSKVSFDSISDLYHPATIDLSYADDGILIKDIRPRVNNEWNTIGSKHRIVTITLKELDIFASFIGEDEASTTRLVSVHSVEIMDILYKLAHQNIHVKDYHTIITKCFDETNDVKAGNIHRVEDKYPSQEDYEMIYSGPHLIVGNPLSKTPKKACKQKSDYDVIDLCTISDNYLPRTNYQRSISLESYKSFVKGFPIGGLDCDNPTYDSWIEHYKMGFRLMLNQAGERTLFGAILPSKSSHISTLLSVTFKHNSDLVEFSGLAQSIIYDFIIKALNTGALNFNSVESFPMGIADKFKSALFVRTLMLNCLTYHYAELWSDVWSNGFREQTWSINDNRLKQFTTLQRDWTWDTPLRNYYERRQALVEIDVIAAMALGLSLQDLEIIYNIQFPVLQQNENDTWYDAEGKIVFTCSKGLTGVGLDRKRNAKTGMLGWEDIRGEQIDENTYRGTAPTHTHTIDLAKSELYGGQQVTYYAPFTKCDRIEDYRTAWTHFEKEFADK